MNSPITSFLEQHSEYNITSLAAACEISRVTLSRIIHRRQLPLFETGEKLRKITDNEIQYVDLLSYYRSLNKR